MWKWEANISFIKHIKLCWVLIRRNRIRNTEIRGQLGVKSLQQYVEQKSLQWWGHVKWMAPESLPKRAMEMKIKNMKRSLL